MLGLGIGWDAAALGWGTNEFDRMGLPFPSTRERQQALAEAIEIMHGVWGSAPFTYRGRHYAANDAHVAPPPRQGVPPIIIAGAGERTLGQVAEFADACNIGSMVTGGVNTPDEARHKLDVLCRHCECGGRRYEDILRTHFTIWVILAEDEEAARRKVERYFPSGLDEIWRHAVFAGTPAQAVSYFQSYADIGMQYFVAQVLDATGHETFRLLAQKVAPHVRAPSDRTAKTAFGVDRAPSA